MIYGNYYVASFQNDHYHCFTVMITGILLPKPLPDFLCIWWKAGWNSETSLRLGMIKVSSRMLAVSEGKDSVNKHII